MNVITANTPDEGLYDALWALKANGVVNTSRNGTVIQMRGPTTIVYPRPDRRVLFNTVRDANPFFHFYEALWMLDGANDVARVAGFAKNMQNFSDDGVTLHGAYGWRWRKAFDVDQLKEVVGMLKRNYSDRRVVLQMWDSRLDLNKPERKDVPCNTHVYFDGTLGSSLNMTVCNRSNDAVWGCFGANLVHMSMLHEFVASASGFNLGTYYQIANNFHFYADRPDCQRLMSAQNLADRDSWLVLDTGKARWYDGLSTYAMLQPSDTGEKWLDHLSHFMETENPAFNAPLFFQMVAHPIVSAHRAFKSGSFSRAREIIRHCAAEDWRLACLEWLDRREASAKAATNE